MTKPPFPSAPGGRGQTAAPLPPQQADSGNAIREIFRRQARSAPGSIRAIASSGARPGAPDMWIARTMSDLPYPAVRPRSPSGQRWETKRHNALDGGTPSQQSQIEGIPSSVAGSIAIVWGTAAGPAGEEMEKLRNGGKLAAATAPPKKTVSHNLMPSSMKRSVSSMDVDVSVGTAQAAAWETFPYFRQPDLFPRSGSLPGSGNGGGWPRMLSNAREVRAAGCG
jgi:hypothetical protein